jgi:arylsulfatase A-like enzyme
MSAPPNILWIVTTQWRAHATGYAGEPNARTPCLDALAALSVNYTQAVTPHPFSPFARAALLTGIPSPGNGVRDYFDPLPAGTRTIAHALAERGYATAFFGKWHLAARDPAAALVGEAHARMIVPPEARGGFAFWEGFESGFLLNDPWVHGTELPAPVQLRGYQSDVLVDRLQQWRGRHAGAQPWFCVLSLEPPHPPSAADAAGVPPRDPAELILRPNVPRGGTVERQARRDLAGYYAHVEATDRAIGRLLAAFGRDAGSGPTFSVFTSVHGDMHGAHGLFRKGWPHEESVRVPLLIRGPWAHGGSVNPAPVSLCDLPAAAIAWADGGTPRLGRLQTRISMPSVVALPHQCDRVWSGVRTASRKLVLNADGTPWLGFDLENDPWELRNLAGDDAWLAENAFLRAAALGATGEAVGPGTQPSS